MCDLCFLFHIEIEGKGGWIIGGGGGKGSVAPPPSQIIGGSNVHRVELQLVNSK